MGTEIESFNVCHPWKASAAIAGLALGAGLLSMALAGWYYDTKLEAVQKAHRQEIKAMESRHTRDKKSTHGEVIERLDRIERLSISKGKE